MRLSFSVGELESLIRQLAKTDKYTLLFNAKESGVRIFENFINLSYAQRIFLAYLTMYSNLFMDLSLGDVSERVLENTLFEDAYLFFKSKEHRKKMKPQKQKVGKEKETIGSTEFVFRKKRQ